MREFRLKEGSRIAIIGGGPAGSFSVHFIQKFAKREGINLSLTIFDGKDFLERGPRGCNLCAGVLSETLLQSLKEEGIFLPERRIISRLEGYFLHVGEDSLSLSCEEQKKNKISTVFRGNGPRYSHFPQIISFDDFLLSYAQDCGAKVIALPVWEITLPQRRHDPLLLYFGQKQKSEKFEADLVVGAFGVNTRLLEKVQSLGFGYQPPSTLTTYQAEFKLGSEVIEKKFGSSIHVYLPKSRILKYGTLIPKGEYLTVTLVGRKDASPEMIKEFFNLKEIDAFTSLRPCCLCYPKIPVTPAKKPFSDRLVIIGDASFSRHYKNGIESAFFTAKLAAEAAFLYGIDGESFLFHYYKRAKKRLIRDNAYGRFIFFLNDFISSSNLFSQVHLDLAQKKNKQGGILRSILWNLFTGNMSYKQIFMSLLNLKLQILIFLHTIKIILMKIKMG